MTATVLRGDARSLPLPDGCVDLVVTSPPYFGLRSYTDGGEHYAGQIGSEETPREYVANLLDCTREWMRVLKPGGSIFVNLGDSYSARADGSAGRTWREDRADALPGVRNTIGFAPRKSLMGLPWRYALGCIDDLSLILRAEIIWAKPNGLPESVTDRVRRSHEQVFHFTREPRYYSAVDEIREPQQSLGERHVGRSGYVGAPSYIARSFSERSLNPLGKLPGSVWDIASQPLTVPAALGVDHFAAFPCELPRRIILGWSPPEICAGCGEGRRPVPAAVALDPSRPQARRAQQLADRAGLTEAHLGALLSVGVSDTGRGAATQSGTGKNTAEVYALAAEARTALGGYAREYLLRRPTGFVYVCACPQPDAPTRPALVLDPFGGTGTTALVADALGRTGITVDRSADYCRLARWRTTDPGERAKAMQVPKPPPVADGQGSLFDEVA
jgi:DNA modification methylase